MDEIKRACIICGAELDDTAAPCPQCGNVIEAAATSDLPEEETTSTESEAADENPPEARNENDPPKGSGRGIIAGIALGTLVIGLLIGYFLNSLSGTGNIKTLSGPWTGTMKFTKMTSSDKTFEKENQGSLNQPESIEINVYMFNNKSGGVSIRGLTETGATSPLTYTGNKMKFSIKSGDILASFDCNISKDKATGDNKMKGTIKYTGKVDNGTGKKIDIAATGDLDLTLKKK